MTLEQKRVLALARGRVRLLASEGAARPTMTEEDFKQLRMADPTLDMSGMQQAAAGAGKAVSDVGLGVRQIGSYAGIGNREVLSREYKERRKRDAPLMDTGAGMVGNIAGNIGMAMTPGIALRAAGGVANAPGLVSAGNALLAPSTAKGGAALGGGFGAVQPTENIAGRAGNVALGVGTGGAIPAIARSGQIGQALVDPLHDAGQRKILGRLLRKVSEENADDVAARMAGAGELVPGSQPTAGGVANSGGIAALERAAMQANPESYAARQMDQNAARIAALRGIAGDEQQMGWAKGVRGLMSETLYKDAAEQGIDQGMASALKPQIKNLLDRPSIGPAVAKAREIFGEESIVLSKQGDVRGLQMMKQALDDVIGKAGSPTSSIGKNQLRALQQTRSDLISVMDELSPKLREADKAFATWSRPVSQMKIGQALVNKLEPALTQGNIPIRMNAETYARALREGDVLARKATGFEGATMKGTMDPSQLATLEAIRDDLSRSATAASLGRGAGSNTFQNLAQENLLQQAGVQQLPQLLSRPVQLTNYALRTIYGAANRDMQRKLADALLNPREAAAMMREATPQQRMMIIQALRSITPAGVAAPGIINANQ